MGVRARLPTRPASSDTDGRARTCRGGRVHADTCVHPQTSFSADVSLSDGPQAWCASRVEGERLVFLSHYTD